MALRFSVLGSGSSGNATFLDNDGFGLLIDVGLGPRQIASRLASVGASWQHVNAVLLTHTHGDHWRDRTLLHLKQLQIPLYCHPEHHGVLQVHSPSFRLLQKVDLVRSYDRNEEFSLSRQTRCRSLEVRHDSAPTFGFRLEGEGGVLRHSWSIGYLADLGCWSKDLVEAVANVDLLALEFNHDEQMETTSGRPSELIERVLGDEGHLSNRQAAGFLEAVLEQSSSNGPSHLVQLHLSRQCNRPALAKSAAQAIIASADTAIHVCTAGQDLATPMQSLNAASPKTNRIGCKMARVPRHEYVQPVLPGFE